MQLKKYKIKKIKLLNNQRLTKLSQNKKIFPPKILLNQMKLKNQKKKFKIKLKIKQKHKTKQVAQKLLQQERDFLRTATRNK